MKSAELAVTLGELSDELRAVTHVLQAVDAIGSTRGEREKQSVIRGCAAIVDGVTQAVEGLSDSIA